MIRCGGLRSTLRRIAAAMAGALLLALAATSASAQAVPSFGHAIVVQRDGEPRLLVDGKPFFFVGGAFFYERIPRSRWRDAMERLRELGANTLDLYVPWNWHELADGDFDFTGTTSPRRDLREVLRLGKQMGFFFIVRPGPVIRNEWRNGGYPAWLLTRPEYGMPLHDVLEGRYPATATLQNARSDDAAAQWMRNATHLRYAARWLHRALAEFRPVADRVIAVQLDDDQGAYLDNDTYPAPHFHAYLGWLERQARDVVGPLTPAFINTFEMKVPSSAPVWAMGNWYQSDADKIGEHDRAELAFATATLRTNGRGPLAYSEFQAGWLAGPESPTPRQAHYTNTSLALGELAGWGVKGVIDFPPFDTLAPFGWEAPFSNALYAWDAAYRLDLGTRMFDIDSDRFSRWHTTWRMFAAFRVFGPALAEAHRVADVALAYDGRGDAFHAAGELKLALAACRARNVSCDAIDPATVTDARLRSFREILSAAPLPPSLAARARSLRLPVVRSLPGTADAERPQITVLRGAHGTFYVVENWADRAVHVRARDLPRSAAAVTPFVVGARDARIVAVDVDLAYVLPRYRRGDRLSTSCPFYPRAEAPPLAGVPWFTGNSPTRSFNPDDEPCTVDATLSGSHERWQLDGTHSVALLSGSRPVSGWLQIMGGVPGPGLKLGSNANFPTTKLPHDAPAAPEASLVDVFEDGSDAVVLRNARTTAILVPQGGARAVFFAPLEPYGGSDNIFNATGALRDDVLVQPPASVTDRIAKYTHTYPAGMFNRPYSACTFRTARGAGAYLAYDAADVVPHGAHFERVVWLGADTERLVVDERFTAAAAPDQRLVSLSAIPPFTYGDLSLIDGDAALPKDGVAAIEPKAGGVAGGRAPSPYFESLVVSVAWRPGDVEAAAWNSGTLRLVMAPGGWRRVTYAYARGLDELGQRSFKQAERAWAGANPPPTSEDGEVAKRYTQSPQKRPSESSCGFESHLPQ